MLPSCEKNLFFSQNFSKTIYRFKAFEFAPFWMPTLANQSKNLKGPQVSTVAVPWNGGKPNTTSRKLHAIPFIHVASHSHMVAWKKRKCKLSISLWVPAMQRVSINIWPVWKIQHQLCWQLESSPWMCHSMRLWIHHLGCLSFSVPHVGVF